MAKKERISAQEVLETISGFLELLDGEKLQKLDKLDSLDEISSIKAKQDALEAKLTAVDQKMSEFVKPEDFEQKLKKRDEAFNKAIRGVPTEVKVKNDPVCLAQEDRDMLDGLKSQLDKRNRRFSLFSQIISGNKIWFLYLILTAVFSIGITILVMKNSVNEWAHRAMIAAIDMNDENPIGVYLTCRAEMPGDRKRYKDKVKSMERRAEKILYLESLLTDYVNGEYKVTEYDAREEKGSILYLAICKYAGSDEEHIFKLTLTDGVVVRVEERRKNVNKKKGDPEFKWVQMAPVRVGD